MKKTLKLSALFLALLMALSVFVACAGDVTEETKPSGNNGNNNNNNGGSDVVTDEPTETDDWGQTVIKDNLDGLDFEGEDVNILVRNETDPRYSREWYCRAEKMDALDTKVFERNERVMSRLKVKLVFHDNPNADTKMNDEILLAAKAGKGKYDVVNNYAAYSTSTTVLMYYSNLTNPKFEHMDITKNYWNQPFIEAATAFGNLYVIVGDMNLSVYDRAIVCYFNQTLASTYMKGIDIYQMVKDGDWTYQEFYDLIAEINVDNGTADTEDDTLGVVSILGSEFCDGFLYSMGAELTEFDEANQKHVVVTGTKKTTLSDAFTKTAEFWKAEGARVIDKSLNAVKYFASGKSLFLIDIIYHSAEINKNISDMSTTYGYGIIPMPKLDTKQEKYYAGIQDAHGVTSVIEHWGQNWACVSATLEALNSDSYSELRPWYIEIVLKTQYVDDAASVEVFKYILDGTRWDFGDVYAGAGHVRNAIWRNPIKDGDLNITTAYDGNYITVNDSLADLDKWFQENT